MIWVTLARTARKMQLVSDSMGSVLGPVLGVLRPWLPWAEEVVYVAKSVRAMIAFPTSLVFFVFCCFFVRFRLGRVSQGPFVRSLVRSWGWGFFF